MKIARVAALLLAVSSATQLEKMENDDKDMKLAQSFASAMNMVPPKLMTTQPLPNAGKDECPNPGAKLTMAASGGAFLDGCYMNTTRTQERNEATGEEAQHYLYMWKHACAFTKWVPSNQFMYSGLDYDDNTMTLERFGFIGMDKRCFWGSIGVLWKRPLPVEQILPNNTIPAAPKKIEEHPIVVDKKFGKQIGLLVNRKSPAKAGLCLGEEGTGAQITNKCTLAANQWSYHTGGQLKHVNDNMCVTTKGSKNGNKITVEKCDGGVDQKWTQLRIAAKPDTEWFQLESQLYKGMCIDIGGHKALMDGRKIQMYACRTNLGGLNGDNFEYKFSATAS